MSEDINKLLDSILANKNIDATQLFNSIVSAKVETALDAQKALVAASIFSKKEEEAAE